MNLRKKTSPNTPKNAEDYIKLNLTAVNAELRIFTTELSHKLTLTFPIFFSLLSSPVIRNYSFFSLLWHVRNFFNENSSTGKEEGTKIKKTLLFFESIEYRRRFIGSLLSFFFACSLLKKTF